MYRDPDDSVPLSAFKLINDLEGEVSGSDLSPQRSFRILYSTIWMYQYWQASHHASEIVAKPIGDSGCVDNTFPLCLGLCELFLPA